MTQKHRVVILGGGFAGLNAALKLGRAPVEVTLVDRRNFHLFQPLLYQVATGSLSPGEISAPIRGVLSKQKNTLVLMGEAMGIDPDAKRVRLRDGACLDYDSLIVATGSKTSYYGKDEWREYAPSLKTVEEATAIRHKLLYAFERAERCASEADVHEWLTFVIVGAGATGLELAGALAEIANETLKNDFRRINPKDARIILIEGGNRVLPAYPPDLSEKAEKLVKRLGVEVMKGVMATAIDSSGVTYKRGDAIETLARREHRRHLLGGLFVGPVHESRGNDLDPRVILEHRVEGLPQHRDLLRRQAGRRDDGIGHLLPGEDQLQHAFVRSVFREDHHQRDSAQIGMLPGRELDQHVDLLLGEPIGPGDFNARP